MEFLLFILFLTFSSNVSQSRLHNNFTDLESVLAFKSHVTDPRGILAANWTTNTSFCSWIGIYCSHLHQRVTAIRLNSYSLQGTISSHIANLSFLSALDLGNNTLTGPIPESIGQLPRLTYIVLERNSLSGTIPFNIFNMTSLTDIFLGFNNLSGTLPSNDSMFMLPRLRNLSLSANHFTGEVSANFVRCRDLYMLSLSKNLFRGTIPDEIGSLPELNLLYLGNNKLSGNIPATLGNLTKLSELDLGSNNITGLIPKELGNLRNLQYLALSNCYLIGSIPTSLMNYSLLYSFDLGGNMLTGSVPLDVGKSLPLLNWLHFGYNQLSGGLEFLSSLSNCKNLGYIQIQKNKFEGVLPDSVGNLSTTVQLFFAFENSITGSIPTALGNLSGLAFLGLHMNELSGTIPSELSRLVALQSMSLAFNKISGSLPYELGLMTKLFVIDLQYNLVSGPLPDSLGNISGIQYLYLHHNKLSSSIPESLWTLRSLLHLYLSINTLNGSLSAQVGNLKALTLLDLSMNQLSGNICSALGNLQMLDTLDLSKNLFQGQIPKTFGELISVTYLNLSHNFLTGAIPNSISNLSYLDNLDLSFNKLEGQIPNGRVFSNISIPTLIGNEALCGASQFHLAPCSTNDEANDSMRKLRPLKYALPSIAFIVILFTCLYLMYAYCWRRKVKNMSNVNVSCLDGHKVVSHQELVCATNNFSEANLLGRGGFGSVFKGSLHNGLGIAVKVFNLEVEGASESFDIECQVLKTVRHRNLIKIISVCSNVDFKAIILPFMSNGNLEQWLYAENCFLNLLQRLNIMVDVSLALEYLHHHHPQVVLHCDLKPTNILLDEELVAHLSDFGTAKLLIGDSKSMASTDAPGTIGYIAPEYTSTGKASRMGDVYSFGILLLETFTRKKPIYAEFGEQSNLREWVSKTHPSKILDIVDSNLLDDYFEIDGPLQSQATLQQCISSAVELGLLCSSSSPKQRIPMTNVVARMQKIKMDYLST